MTHSTCNVCSSSKIQLLYTSNTEQSLTSLCQVRPGVTRVYFCTTCGHLQTDEMKDSAAFYESEYDILVNDEDEDQIYEVKSDGTEVYRTNHQVSIFLDKIQLPHGARLLDYGCAKSSMVKSLLSMRADLSPHLFDVSSRYIPFWEKFIEPGRWAIHDIPDKWYSSFDVVTSLFSMEHMVQPMHSVREMASMLKPGGALYCIVPNVNTNFADLIVLDHVNHFSINSLLYLFQSVGLVVESIDEESHRGAFVAVARRPEIAPSLPFTSYSSQEVRNLCIGFQEVASFWSKASEKVCLKESKMPKHSECAIYGAGFYGAFLASCLKAPQHIRCYLDQNIHLQGRELNGRPILKPDRLPEHIEYIWVGLNPAVARTIISQVEKFMPSTVKFLFLD